MVAIPSRHKSLVLLAAVVLAQVLALAVQIKATDTQGDKQSLIRGWTVGAVSPFERAGAWGVDKIRGTWRHYFALSATARENDKLRQENNDLKLQLNELQNKAEEAGRLAALLHFRDEHQSTKMIPARVIGTSADTSSEVIYVDRGARDGLKRNMGVITPDGVVGKVIEVYGDTAQVLLLTDKDSGVGAMLADTRIQSPVGGMGEPLLNMKYVAGDDEVKIGENVVTSGMDRIFPKDLPVGTVVSVKPGMPFKQIRVSPAAKLERLEEVLILPTLEPLQMKVEADASAEQPATESAAENTSAKERTEKPIEKPIGERTKSKPVKEAPAKTPEKTPEKANPTPPQTEPPQ
ncbi:MAG TPA: rod shape-determining protein MreC [Terriglobales bacterium]|nr:rod shape-determining protein MreC [Terriglobales bacterium]